MSCEGEIERKNGVEIDRMLTGINVGIVVGSRLNLLPN
jgi:hypothetical protein